MSVHRVISFNSGSSLNIYELDAASNNSVDDIRALVEQVRYAPQLGKYKVYIIDEVHMLSASAFNAFLKTRLKNHPAMLFSSLPPPRSIKLSPTILSRCQIFDFNRITVEDIAMHLRDIATKKRHCWRWCSSHHSPKSWRSTSGCVEFVWPACKFCRLYTQLLQGCNENLNILDYDYYFKITDDLLAGNMSNRITCLTMKFWTMDSTVIISSTELAIVSISEIYLSVRMR